MSGGFLDDLARRLAEPMPRRRALKLAGAAVVAAAVPGLRPGLSAAAGPVRVARVRPSAASNCPVVCPKTNQGDTPCCGAGSECCVVTNDSFGSGATQCCMTEPVDSGGSGVYREVCVGGKGCEGRFECRYATCGGKCCDKNEQCLGGRCVERCPRGRVRCGNTCCPKGRRCVKGTCRKCPPKQKACGKKCCPKGQDCCYDDAGNFVCCNTKKRACCSVGEPGSTTMTCCAAGTKCAKMILPPKEREAIAGIAKESPTVCCPPERFVAKPRACCPPGHVSLGGKLVLPAGGGGGLCCRKDKVCGSGADVTCCSSGSTLVPELEQTCVDGRCVRVG